MSTFWYNGRFFSNDTIPVSPRAEVWNGKGWFETMAVDRGDVLNLEPHIKRLERSISVRLAWSHQELSSVFQQLSEEWGTEPGRLKWVVWDEHDDLNSAAWVREYSPPDQDQYQNGVSVEVRRRTVPPRWPHSAEKRTQYGPVLASRDRSEADYLLYCGNEGTVWETGIANIGWCHEDTIYLPEVDRKVLPGTVLRAVKDYADALEISCETGKFDVGFIQGETVLMNSLIGLLPVRCINDRELPVNPGSSNWRSLREKLQSDNLIPRWVQVES
ncbi:MAG: aminotransferase class IV [bacterium]